MRRFKLFTAALIAVTAVAVSTSTVSLAATPESGPQLPYQISDSFNGSSPDPAIWGYTDQGPNAGTTLAVENGSLQLSASSSASSGFHDGITTGCQAVGDFDARIQFTLTNWPAGDNVSLAVNSITGNTFVEDAFGGDVYGLFVDPSPTLSGYSYTTIPALPVRSGELLLSRRGDQISSYIRYGYAGNWSQIAQFTGSTSPTFIDLAIWNVSDFGGQPVSVQINSFELDAAGLSC